MKTLTQKIKIVESCEVIFHLLSSAAQLSNMKTIVYHKERTGRPSFTANHAKNIDYFIFLSCNRFGCKWRKQRNVLRLEETGLRGRDKQIRLILLRIQNQENTPNKENEAARLTRFPSRGQQQSLTGDNKHKVRRFLNYLPVSPLFCRPPTKLCSRVASH